jgi:glycosyltransferase involved in cell wall biosynthesis
VPKQNPLALAKAIARMRQKHGDYSQEKIRQRCLENYSHEVVGERLIELYLQVLSRLP